MMQHHTRALISREYVVGTLGTVHPDGELRRTGRDHPQIYCV